MSELMKARTTKGFVDFTIRVPRDKAYVFNKMLRGMLEMSGLARPTNEEGEEIYTPEEVFADARPGDALLGLRTKEGITQQQLADTLGIAQSRVAQLESGARPISLAMAKRIGKAYNTSYKHFL